MSNICRLNFRSGIAFLLMMCILLRGIDKNIIPLKVLTDSITSKTDSHDRYESCYIRGNNAASGYAGTPQVRPGERLLGYIRGSRSQCRGVPCQLRDSGCVRYTTSGKRYRTLMRSRPSRIRGGYFRHSLRRGQDRYLLS